jgi:DNA mismatch repair protein MutS2
VLFNEQIIAWKDARHPLLEATLKKEGKQIIPLTLRLTPEQHILLISGPNAGGKSVCLKTVGLLQYMLQCGFLIPLSEASECGIFESICIDIGDEQSLENDLSTYSSHLQNMKFFLRNASQQTLVLIDEFGTGTEPQLGGAIAEAVLQTLVQRKTFGVITTHYANLKHYATSAGGVQNGAMLFDLQKIEPLFKLEVGAPGSSFAFEIAKKIGLPDEVLQNAKSKLGEEHVNFDRSLRNIARDKKYWEEKRTRIKNTDKNLELLLEKYQAELQQLHSERKRIISSAQVEAKRLISEANKQIESTIREIKEAQAEKEKTRATRTLLGKFSQEIESSNDEQSQKIEHKIAQLKEQEERRKEKKQRKEQVNIQEELKESPTPTITVGSPVRLIEQDVLGEVMKINDNGTIIVAVGNLLTTIAADKIIPSSKSEYKKMQHTRNASAGSTSMSVKRLNFKPQIDLRGQRVEEAIPEVQELIDEALMYGVDEVKILHGKGTGILKEQIRRYLKSMPCVDSIADEHVEFGGAGITVVRLS